MRCHWVAVALTQVQTKHKRNNTKNTVQTIKKHRTNNTKHSKYKYTYYQNNHTLQNPHITKPIHTHTHTLQNKLQQTQCKLKQTVQDIPK
jgi:hypothetical protein